MVWKLVRITIQFIIHVSQRLFRSNFRFLELHLFCILLKYSVVLKKFGSYLSFVLVILHIYNSLINDLFEVPIL
jgi:hypothetical protein